MINLRIYARLFFDGVMDALSSYKRVSKSTLKNRVRWKSEKGWHRKGFISTLFNGVMFSRKCSPSSLCMLSIQKKCIPTQRTPTPSFCVYAHKNVKWTFIGNPMFKQCSPNTFPIIKTFLCTTYTHTHTGSHSFIPLHVTLTAFIWSKCCNYVMEL